MSTSGRRKEAGSLIGNPADYVSSQEFGNPQHLFHNNISGKSLFAPGTHVQTTHLGTPHGGVRGGTYPSESLTEFCTADAAYSKSRC